MAKVLVTEQSLADIATAIRGKNGLATEYLPSEMAAAITTIPVPTLGTKNITANGTYNASSDSLGGYSSVTVAVPLGSKSITANGTYNANDDDLSGFSSVTVNVSYDNYDSESF